jgi:hypothetical protein
MPVPQKLQRTHANCHNIQNPGFLVTVKPAIKPPGFQVFLFNRC